MSKNYCILTAIASILFP